MNGRVIVAAAVLLAAQVARAAVTAQARLDPPRVAVGDGAALAVEVRGSQNAGTPSVPVPDGVGIQYVGPATQLSIVNGQTTSSITHHFTVTPRREGTFTIGPITVAADGQTLQAGTVTLQAAAGGGGEAPAGEQLRLDLGARRTTVYLHERVPLTVTLLVGRIQVGDVQYPQVPGDGFALEPMPQPAQRQEVRGGSLFQVVEFQSALTPLRTGTITVGPATMSMSVLSERPRRHGFFFGGAVREPVELTSPPLQLEVLPLPEAGKPADFSGAVGRFSLDVRAAPLDVTAGDPVTLTYTLRGEGDLSSATPPSLAASDALRVYPVQSAAVPAGSAPATRVFEQVVIPQRPGTVELPPVRFSWFDPEARAYRVAEPAPISLTVRAAAPPGGPQIVGAPAGTPAMPAAPVGRDIVFIKDAPGALAPIGAARWRSPVFWGLQVIPLLVWAAAVVIDRRRRRLGTDVRYARFTRAGRAARTALEEARAALARGDAAAFHDRVAGAVTDYLAAKLDLPPGGVTPESVAARLREVRLPDAVSGELREFLGACEVARFAAGTTADGDMRRTLARADTIVRTLERARRLGPVASAAALALAAALLTGGAGAAGEDTPQATFFRANALYADGRYAEAAAAYERVLATGLASAPTYFNLGNAYLKAGQVGPAVLAYERARRLAPGDPDVRANLAFAREQAGAVESAPWWSRFLPLAASWSSDTLLLAAALAWWTLALCLVARRLAPRIRRAATRGVLVAAAALLVAGSSAAYRLGTVDLRRAAVVVAPAEVAVRFEPSSTGTVHFQAKPGATLRVLAEREGWVQVARDDGLRGWVERGAVGEV